MYVIYSAIMDEFSREGHNLHFVWISNHFWEYENMENEDKADGIRERETTIVQRDEEECV